MRKLEVAGLTRQANLRLIILCNALKNDVTK
jgi:hypothetical protein